MSDENKALARQVFEEVQSKGDYALVDELVASDYVVHTPMGVGDVHGPEGVKQFVKTLHKSLPDLKFTVEDQIADGHRVATRWTCRGTHRGEFQGVPATGKRVTMSGITIFHVDDGKLVEAWASPDLLGLMQQIGASPPAGV